MNGATASVWNTMEVECPHRADQHFQDRGPVRAMRHLAKWGGQSDRDTKDSKSTTEQESTVPSI